MATVADIHKWTLTLPDDTEVVAYLPSGSEYPIGAVGHFCTDKDGASKAVIFLDRPKPFAVRPPS